MSFLHPLILGVFATLLALVLELAFSLLPGVFTPLKSSLDGNMLALALFALSEELAKVFFLWKLLSLAPEKKSDRVWAVILFAFGFIATEAVLVFGTTENTPFQAIFGIAFLHAVTILSYAYTLNRTKNPLLIALTIAIATMTHLLYNLFLA